MATKLGEGLRTTGAELELKANAIARWMTIHHRTVRTAMTLSLFAGGLVGALVGSVQNVSAAPDSEAFGDALNQITDLCDSALQCLQKGNLLQVIKPDIDLDDGQLCNLTGSHSSTCSPETLSNLDFRTLAGEGIGVARLNVVDGQVDFFGQQHNLEDLTDKLDELAGSEGQIPTAELVNTPVAPAPTETLTPVVPACENLNCEDLGDSLKVSELPDKAFNPEQLNQMMPDNCEESRFNDLAQPGPGEVVFSRDSDSSAFLELCEEEPHTQILPQDLKVLLDQAVSDQVKPESTEAIVVEGDSTSTQSIDNPDPAYDPKETFYDMISYVGVGLAGVSLAILAYLGGFGLPIPPGKGKGGQRESGKDVREFEEGQKSVEQRKPLPVELNSEHLRGKLVTAEVEVEPQEQEVGSERPLTPQEKIILYKEISNKTRRAAIEALKNTCDATVKEAAKWRDVQRRIDSGELPLE